MKKLVLIFLILVIYFPAAAFNARGGELTYRCIGGMMYEFDMKIWGETWSASDTVCLDFGDNSYHYFSGSDAISNVSLAPVLPSNYSNVQQVTWRTTHTYPGAGVYYINLACIKRVAGITNIPNSVSTSLLLTSQFTIDPSIGCNSAPSNMNGSFFMLFPSMSQANLYALNYVDPDGDSLSYSLVACNEPGYSFPDNLGGGSLIINPTTGQFSWNTPFNQGIYNVVIRVEQWKNLQNNTVLNVGYHELEIQFIVDATNGIEQPVAQSPVLLFPNPATDNIGFLVNENEISEIIITDQLGKEVRRHKSIGEKRFEISVADLSDGMYYYQYMESSERKSSGKFIVKH